MKKGIAAFILLFTLSAAGSWAEAQLVPYGSTGLGTDALKGWLGAGHAQDRIVVKTNEAPVYLLFYWDTGAMEPLVKIVDAEGKLVAEIDLTKGNLVTLKKPGQYVCTLSTMKGSGHWLCVLLGGREWDP
jgi:hypothetical protein